MTDTFRGLWVEADLRRTHSDYVLRVLPLIKGRKWVKCSDIRNYKTSFVVVEMARHLEWALKKACKNGASSQID